MATRSTASGRLPDGGRMLTYLPGLGDFDAPLKTTLAPIAGTGAITYTRATQSYVTDYEGVLRRALSGEARFEGARRVQNGLPYSQTLTDASWITGHSTVTLDTQTINGIPVFRLINDAVIGTHLINKNVSFSFVAGNKYIISCIAKAGTSNYIQLLVSTGVSTEYVNFDLSTGTATAGNTTQSSSVSLGNGFYRISLSITAIASGVFGAYYLIINSASASRYGSYSGAGEYVLLTATQFEDVTGQSIQTVGDYVSTNVLNAFPYHGAGVDGVKYFDTTLTGAKIPESTLKGFLNEGQRTNLLLQSESMVTSWTRGGATAVASPISVPTGLLAGCKLIPNAGTQASQTYQSITTSATNYTFSVYAKACEMSFIQLRANSAISNGYVNFDLVSGTLNAPSTWTGRIEALSNGWYRCIATTETLAATTNNVAINIVSSLTSTNPEAVTGDGTSGLYLWQAQWESGTFASSPITTTTTTATRNTDYLTYNVANTVSSQGSVSCDFTLRYIPTAGIDRRIVCLSASDNNRLMIRATDTSGIQNRSGILVGNGASVLPIYNSFSCSENVTYKVSANWLNGGNATFNASGVNLGNVGPVSVATTQVEIGSTSSTALGLHGNVKNVKIWKTVIDSDALRLLTN